MKFVTELSENAKDTLEEMRKKHPKNKARIRAHMILLSNEGYKINEIAAIHNVRRNNVSYWITNWEEKGVVGLLDKRRSGRPRMLSPEEELRAIELIEEDQRNSKQAQSLLEKETGKEVSEWTFKRTLKRSGLRWKRMRRSVKGKQSAEKVKESREEIAKMQEKENQGEIHIYYFDESGVSTIPTVPYGWQYANETIELPSHRSKRINILGFCSRTNDFYYETVEGWVNSEHVIHCFDNFVANISKKTVIIVDNASIHTSKAFKAKQKEWAEKGVTIYYLPTYSPELNLIEIVWRFLKYQWLLLSAYQSYTQLKKCLTDVLNNIGKEYTISFA